MKRFLNYVFTIAIILILPVGYLIENCSDSNIIYACLASATIMILVCFFVMRSLTKNDIADSENTAKRLRFQLDSEKRYNTNLRQSLKKAKEDIAEFEKTILAYKNEFGLINELNSKLKKIENEYQTRINSFSQDLDKQLANIKDEKIHSMEKSIEWYVKRRHDILQTEEKQLTEQIRISQKELESIDLELNKKIQSSEKALESLNNQIQLFCKSDIESFYVQIANTLFPDKDKFDNWQIDSSDYLALRSEIYERIKSVSKYTDSLEKLQIALSDKKYSPLIYTTLAEAFKNKITADYYENRFNQLDVFQPIARISAELQMLYLRALENRLDWGSSVERAKRVKNIRDLRKEATQKIEEANFARYQLEYLLGIYPQLQDILDIEYKDLGVLHDNMPDEEYHDSTRDYLSNEEYSSLSESERNQLALDRYVSSHRKTKWQIGRDYEMYIGFLCEKEGMDVDYSGSRLKYEDLGRDLIAEGPNSIYIIQCKYWSHEKLIHEKHIMQLYGTLMEYRITHQSSKAVFGVFVTSTKLSDMAKKFSEVLKIKVYECVPIKEYPLIKCNINRDEYGTTTYIYHLPMDLSYDVTKINSPGEFMAYTVKEAEEAGFRRSYKYHGR